MSIPLSALYPLVAALGMGQGFPTGYESRSPVPYGGCNGGSYAYGGNGYGAGAYGYPSPGEETGYAYPGAYGGTGGYPGPGYPGTYAGQAGSAGTYAAGYPALPDPRFDPRFAPRFPQAFSAGPRLDIRFQFGRRPHFRRPDIRLQISPRQFSAPAPYSGCGPFGCFP